MPLEWNSDSVEILLNPKLGRRLETEAKLRVLKGYASHVWLATSGSRKQKFVALSKTALLTSARAVNRFLEADSKDVWFNPLPIFHVGGLSIWARAHLSSAGVAIYPDVTKQKWDVKRFYEALKCSNATLLSLVPAQIYDIVAEQLKSPPALRAALVGGGYLSETLFNKAKELGWPLAPTYGLTECCSQVATAKPGERDLKILDHVEVNIDASGVLRLKSPALLTAYAYELKERMFVEDPKRGEWYLTSDLATINKDILEVHGRIDDVVKVGGESVLITRLERLLIELMHQSGIWEGIMVVAGNDERLGTVVEALAEKSMNRAQAESIVSRFNEAVLPFERIRKINWVDSIPRTILGKMIKRSQ